MSKTSALPFLDLPRQDPQKASAEQRILRFDEIYGRFDSTGAAQQAGRCLHCSNSYCE